MEEPANKWYYNPVVLSILILCFGPLGLVPLWTRPKTSVILKVAVSVIVILVTILLSVSTLETVQLVMERYRELANVM